jgi:murein DD-endopeptidase MepM/ murein hydrolase activator NlpD
VQLATAVLTALLALPVPPVPTTDPTGEWPLRPRPEVVAAYDPPSSAWGAGHRGVDLAGTVGQPVRAALEGTLTFAGTIAGRPVVVVDHGDTRTTYEPVTSDLPLGTRLAAGDPVGNLVLSGSHCLPRACLHWGWLRGDTYLDPLLLVGGGPVRLLPLDGLTLLDVPGPVPAAGEPAWRPLAEEWAARRWW